ncbi:BZ3500_MvSof-1268-A1-R1_Chr3-3g06500 [Microbotryum saponariae]|uniref:BZ3500_MvSof-1268-A1-R1_Chr3-3g06500 protein n=1 Tax=Microbotryum saponariae TaxID=289078 RepID=A0A2X0MYP9_9BASI|nr:BZ3500_MvSof-1268-A1-R1_Chr3-3g06500 [Microbotryum saponariae]SDA04467.1 BZ3501_MvSof-1269-A2-R1_Chr3-2g06187 [Microbotryum saponariae]
MSIPHHPPSTDVRRRTTQPQTLQQAQTSTTTHLPLSSALLNDLDSQASLDNMEAELNKTVDTEVEVLAEGIVELVRCAVIKDKDHFRVSQEAFASKVRTEAMIRSAQSLLSLSHTLKLLHLFADTCTPALAREATVRELDEMVESAKTELGMAVV